MQLYSLELSCSARERCFKWCTVWWPCTEWQVFFLVWPSRSTTIGLLPSTVNTYYGLRLCKDLLWRLEVVLCKAQHRNIHPCRSLIHPPVAILIFIDPSYTIHCTAGVLLVLNTKCTFNIPNTSFHFNWKLSTPLNLYMYIMNIIHVQFINIIWFI